MLLTLRLVLSSRTIKANQTRSNQIAGDGWIAKRSRATFDELENERHSFSTSSNWLVLDDLRSRFGFSGCLTTTTRKNDVVNEALLIFDPNLLEQMNRCWFIKPEKNSFALSTFSTVFSVLASKGEVPRIVNDLFDSKNVYSLKHAVSTSLSMCLGLINVVRP